MDGKNFVFQQKKYGMDTSPCFFWVVCVCVFFGFFFGGGGGGEGLTSFQRKTIIVIIPCWYPLVIKNPFFKRDLSTLKGKNLILKLRVSSLKGE